MWFTNCKKDLILVLSAKLLFITAIKNVVNHMNVLIKPEDSAGPEASHVSCFFVLMMHQRIHHFCSKGHPLVSSFITAPHP